MIPSPFTFYKPNNIEKAVSLMSDFGDEARVIAGGHSLIPVMKQRLTDIKHLIDLSGINEIKGIEITGNQISIGAMTTQVELINNEELFKKLESFGDLCKIPIKKVLSSLNMSQRIWPHYYCLNLDEYCK